MQLVLRKEKLFLQPLPAAPFELAVWKVATVQYNYHINVERMNYSVPYEYIKQQVDVRLTRTTVEIFFAGTRIASHLRLHGPSQPVQHGGRAICRRTTRATCNGMASVSSAGRSRSASIPLPWYGCSSPPTRWSSRATSLYGFVKTGGPLFPLSGWRALAGKPSLTLPPPA